MNTTIVAPIAKAANMALLGSPPTKESNKTQTAPTGAWPEPNANAPVLVKGEKALTINSLETPAAINKLTPDPNPHLLIISSINNISKQPIINCKTKRNCILKKAEGTKVAAGDKPPKKT